MAVTKKKAPKRKAAKKAPVKKPIAKALDVQVGGNFYKSLAIQPVEYCYHNGIPALESSIIKYVTRHRAKNGLEDLKKARHCIDLLIQLEHNQ